MAEAFGHRGTRAVQRMVEYAPSTGGLALWVRHHDLRDDEVRSEIACGPPLAQRGSVGSDLEHQLRQLGAFALGMG